MNATQDFLNDVVRRIKQDEHETRLRIDRMVGLDGDADRVSRREWRLHRERTSCLARQRDAILKAMAEQLAVSPPPRC